MQDWLIRFQLQAVQGVAEVAPIGGFVKQYQLKSAQQSSLYFKLRLKM